jgi:hypothetical protein
MSTLEDLKKAVDSLLRLEQEDLLRYLSTRIQDAQQLDQAQRLTPDRTWITEEESDLQYVIPETHYQPATNRRKEE